MCEKSVFDLGDCELVELAVCGDASAFSVLLKRYSHKIAEKAKSFNYTQGFEEEDFYQEGVIGFYSAVFSYDPSKSDSFSAYSMMLTEQAMQRLYNSANRQKHSPLQNYVQIDELSKMESDTLSPEDIVIFKEKENEFYSSLSKFEFAVAKYYLLGYSRKVISEKLNCTLKQVDNAVQRIRNKISN